MERPFILAFDTSGPYCASALWAGEDLVEHRIEEMKKGQAERLMFVLEGLLSQNGLGYQDLDALAVGTGPGNFTGIRIGVAAARGLALGLGIPAYGVNGFEQRARLEPEREVHSIPAPRDQYYVSHQGEARILSRQEFESQGHPAAQTHSIAALVCSIAKVARSRWPKTAPAPAPYYLRPADAAPPKDVAPPLLP